MDAGCRNLPLKHAVARLVSNYSRTHSLTTRVTNFCVYRSKCLASDCRYFAATKRGEEHYTASHQQGRFELLVRIVLHTKKCRLKSRTCPWWTLGRMKQFHLSRNPDEPNSRLIFSISFRLCFYFLAFICTLFPLSSCLTVSFTQIFSITIFNQYHDPKSECDYLYVA